VEVVANQPQTLPQVRLEPADGRLRITSHPVGASVTIAGEYAGQTPLEILVPANEAQEVRISKAGYEGVTRTAVVRSGAEASLSVTLSARMGTVEVVAEPTDAQLFVNGKARGPASQRLSLAAVPHNLEIRSKGYRTFRTQVMPRVGYPQVVKVRLEPVTAAGGAPRPSAIEGPNGHRLRLVAPAAITMGASRREQGRRGNETLRKVVLTRPFYMGTQEVTNGQFRQFDAKHYAAPFQGQAISSDNQPVVNVTWEQAAQYCNWLSAKELLPAVYEHKNGTWVAKRPLPDGYRLPTEAEWARAARFVSAAPPTTFPWGNGLPPPPDAGNYADDAASTMLANTIRAYNDGYATSAPVGSFDPNPLGLYDVGGNVAEWTHDYYAIYPTASEQVETDPLGPAEGRHHVIRGASWMHASLSALRWTFRDYGDQPRPDVGFRIARNAN
jgi:formylglycine-generating enzyme required for sulfatase activity